MRIKEDIIFIDILNSNDRIYDTKSCEKIISDFKEKTIVYGEKNQPSSFDISIKNVSHVIHDLYIIDNKLRADIELLDKNIINQYPNFGFSTDV